MNLSVIICTHNPRRDYLLEVLVALKNQTLPYESWELLLIDNASDSLLASEYDLSWQPNAKYLREEQKGKVYALLQAIRYAKGEILITVDDDNVLDADYLENTVRIGQKFPFLGAWNGQSRPKFEQSPPDWTKSFWSLLALDEFDRDTWSNVPFQPETTLYGAGMCFRSEVAIIYEQDLQQHPERQGFGPTGSNLLRGDDWYICLAVFKADLGIGRFTCLKLTHLMPAFRFQEDYLLRLVEGSYYSGTMFHALRGKPQPKPSWRSQLRQYIRRCFMDSRSRRFHDATQRGINRAFKEIANSNV